MRDQYTRIIRRHLRSLNLYWLFRHALRYAACPVGFRLGRPLAGPTLGTFFVTYRCNAACAFCDLPGKAGQFGRELDTPAMKKILDQFAELATSGMGFTGGEPLVREDIFELMAYSKALGMHTHLNTNGLALDEKCIHRLFEIGLDSINISLDGALSETHDRIRSRPGLYDKIMKAIELIKAGRRDSGPELTLVSVISPDNIDEIRGLVELAERKGVDRIGFMPVHPYFEEDKGAVPEKEKFYAKIPGLVDYLLEKKKKSDIIDSSEKYIKLFEPALRGKESPLTCTAGYNSLSVDCYGNVYPCMPWIEVARPAANISGTTLKEIWISESYAETRQQIKKCHMCFWNCHTEMNLLFQRFI